VVASLDLSIPRTEVRVKKVEKAELKGVILTFFTSIPLLLGSLECTAG
jgi:hypothetical protein